MCDAAMLPEHEDTYSASADDIETGIGMCNFAWIYPPWQKTNSPAVDRPVSGQSCQLASVKMSSSDIGTLWDLAI